MHTNHKMGGLYPYSLSQTKSAKQDAANQNSNDNPFNSSHRPNVLEEHIDEPLAKPESLYPTFYNIDDFTGYCENQSFIVEPSSTIPAVPQFNHHQAEPFDSFAGYPNEQAVYNSPEVLNQQQRHQVQPFSTFTSYPQNTHEVLFRSGDEPSSQSSLSSQIAQQGYHSSFS